MNGTIITEKNFNHVASRLIKFFNGADVVYWHSFDCGMKRHIPTDFVYQGKERMRCVYRYPHVSCELGDLDRRKFVRLQLNNDCGACLKVGDVVKFCGNRVQIRTEFIGSHFKWCYDTFQLWDSNGGFKDIQPERESIW